MLSFVKTFVKLLNVPMEVFFGEGLPRLRKATKVLLEWLGDSRGGEEGGELEWSRAHWNKRGYSDLSISHWNWMKTRREMGWRVSVPVEVRVSKEGLFGKAGDCFSLVSFR